MKTRLRYARGFAALNMFQEAREEIRHIANLPAPLPPEAIFLLDGISEREAEHMMSLRVIAGGNRAGRCVSSVAWRPS